MGTFFQVTFGPSNIVLVRDSVWLHCSPGVTSVVLEECVTYIVHCRNSFLILHHQPPVREWSCDLASFRVLLTPFRIVCLCNDAQKFSASAREESCLLPSSMNFCSILWQSGLFFPMQHLALKEKPRAWLKGRKNMKWLLKRGRWPLAFILSFPHGNN